MQKLKGQSDTFRQHTRSLDSVFPNFTPATSATSPTRTSLRSHQPHAVRSSLSSVTRLHPFSFLTRPTNVIPRPGLNNNQFYDVYSGWGCASCQYQNPSWKRGWFHLKLNCDEKLSNVAAFNFNVRRYTQKPFRCRNSI